jgi:hypothetical protein
MNAIWVQLVVPEEHTDAVLDALTLIVEDERVRAGVVDAMEVYDCPTLLCDFNSISQT